MAQRRPNILYILADDLGQGDVSCFNPQAQFTTENMDRLAREGMRFTDSHSTSALCTPSRYGLMTGRYNWRSPLKRSVLPGDSMALIEKHRLTVPKFLRSAGYRTAVVGKWHLGLDWQLKDSGDDLESFGLDPEAHPRPEHRYGRNGNFDPQHLYEVEGLDIDYSKPVTFGPNEMGFDYSFITAASLDQPPFVFIENGQAQGIPTTFGGDQYHLDRRTDAQQQQIQKGPMVDGYDVHEVAPSFQAKALEVLDDMLEGDDPWFLYVPSHLVHGPIIPNEPWQGRSGVGAYGDFVLQFDDYVGQLVERIDEAGAGEDTVVIVTSDNGASGVAGLPALHAQGHDPSNGRRGHKTDIWEGGHREPHIVRWPGQIEPGSCSPFLISHSDLFATLAEVLDSGIPDEAAEDSTSNLPLWRGGDDPVRTDVVSHSGGGGFALRQGEWKLAFTTTGDGMDADWEAAHGGPATRYVPAQLYHLGEDPAEQHNVIDEHPERVRRMQTVLEDHIVRGRSTPGPDQPNHRNDPSGEWPQIDWMSGADEVRSRAKSQGPG
ncbi:sulfatase family protein [Brevibacterium aurantiacum]|uniref:sulfatase family protein n=1 Tax=Brevibacterium aurantiacum TaxID=273384 RepID=UPI00186717C8|nr:arylsulfatase [Brevibacterium aurantiacum]